MDDISALSLQQLMKQCQQEMHKFRQGYANDSSFCLEIFQRALQGKHTSEFDESWQTLEEAFTSQLERWFYRHTKYREALAREEASFYIHGAFEQLFAASLKKQLLFATLEQAFSYLRRCLHSTILQQLRRASPSQSVPFPEPEPVGPDMVNQVLARLEAQELWNCLVQCTKNERERELVELVYRQNLKPKEIAERFPETFANALEVSRCLASLLARVRRRCLPPGIND